MLTPSKFGISLSTSPNMDNVFSVKSARKSAFNLNRDGVDRVSNAVKRSELRLTLVKNAKIRRKTKRQQMTLTLEKSVIGTTFIGN